MLYSYVMNPVALPPGRDRLSTKPPPTGSETAENTIDTVRVACINGRTVEAMGQDDVRLSRRQFRCMSTNFVSVSAAQRVSTRKLRPML